jgi:hypothetical protein
VALSGPALLTVIVKLIWSPTLGVASLTVLVMARSACCGVSVALAVLLPGVGSNWSAAETVAVFVWTRALFTVAKIVRVTGLPGLTTLTDHSPATES